MSYCKDGEYSENGECKPCPDNTWSNSWDAPKGSVGSPSNQNTACKWCKHAYYSENGECKPCPDHHWASSKILKGSGPSNQSTVCKACPGPLPLGVASYTKNIGGSCYCAPGTMFTNINNAFQCKPCDAGYYQPEERVINGDEMTCIKCPDGSISKGDDREACYCPPGKKFFNGSCVSCESGTYQDVDTLITRDNTSCKPCSGTVNTDSTVCTVSETGGGTVVVTPPTPVVPTPVVPTPVVPTPVVPTPVVPTPKPETKTGGAVTDGTSEISSSGGSTSKGGSTTKTDTSQTNVETTIDKKGGSVTKEQDPGMLAVIIIATVIGAGLLILGGWAGYDWYKKKYGKN